MATVHEVIDSGGASGSLPRENFGLPSLDLTEMQGNPVPPDIEITGVLGDILMCEIADESEDGQTVNRGGIFVSTDISKKLWRVGKVVKAGPQCSDAVKVGDHVMYPSDKGIPMIQHKKKYIFLNEQRIFCTCKFIPVESSNVESNG